MMINFFAVLVATIAAYIVGALWYGPLFGKPWRKLMNVPEGAPMTGMMQAMGGGFIATLIMIAILDQMLAYTGALALGAKVSIAFAGWIWLGFIATTMVNSVFYEKRPWQLYFINVSHYLVALVLATYVLAKWPW